MMKIDEKLPVRNVLSTERLGKVCVMRQEGALWRSG
jgi:hypothetical protein